MKLAICLAGGGVKGAAHIGVLKAIEEGNIKYDYIEGTSSGSIVASLIAMGYKPDEIYELFKKYCKKIKHINFKNIAKLVMGLVIKRSIIIEKIINEAASKKGIYNINQIKENLLIPSVDLNTGMLYMFSSMKKIRLFKN